MAVSRSTLTARFKEVVGTDPLDYLPYWHLEHTSCRLREGNKTVACIARSAGYGSESSFSVSFRRVMGSTPDSFRRAHAAIADHTLELPD
ncbi:helix-turn-helix domain-containing protein [Streptomyces sp. TG1A-8]|uniref:helix-turn-helix domain-containing protein n=1 Tax=Streptomyces sp. TG1A-8 TaxID=3051385 RepID=UPI003463FE11